MRKVWGKLATKLYLMSHREEGQGMVEYGLIIALIALVVIGVLMAIGGQLQGLFGHISNTIANGTNNATG